MRSPLFCDARSDGRKVFLDRFAYASEFWIGKLTGEGLAFGHGSGLDNPVTEALHEAGITLRLDALIQIHIGEVLSKHVTPLDCASGAPSGFLTPSPPQATPTRRPAAQHPTRGALYPAPRCPVRRQIKIDSIFDDR
jgi:hypothetical protein